MGKLWLSEAVENIALLVKKLRTEKGITQEVFLFDTGINVYRIECGQTDITCSTLIAVCDRLDITPAELFEMIEAKLLQEHSTNDQLDIKQQKHIVWKQLIERSTTKQ